MRRTAVPKSVPVGDIDPFRPDVQRPVRVRSRAMPADSHFDPHRHAWAQLAYCASGILQVADARSTFIVPPSRAVWIAPGLLHSVHVLEDAEFRTLYIDASATPPGWSQCRVIVVSPLLRELVHSLDDAAPGSAREAMLATLALDEIAGASTHDLGVPLPDARTGDKRLRAVCEGVMRSPAERGTLAEWASHAGASERTLARLFRDELGMTYHQWRQQAILAHALPMLARGMPVGQVAAACAYASESAFTAMFKAAMGQPPSGFRAKSP